MSGIKSSRNNFVIAFVISLLLTGCNKENSKQKDSDGLEGNITISGAFALYPLVVKWGEEFRKLHPNVTIEVNEGGAGKGIADALHDNVNLGMVSRDVKAEEISAGAWGITVARDAVLPTFSSNNPYAKEILAKGFTKEMFYKVWITGEVVTWGDALGLTLNEPIRKYKRSDASGSGETWAKFLNKSQDELKGIGVMGDPGVAYAVSNDKYGIGFNNIAYVYDLKTQHFVDGIQVIPIDLNENGKIDSNENFYNKRTDLINAIAHNVYPSPPGRDLYFVSNGPPKDKLVLEFFKWILTDGQKYVPEMGYLRLPSNYVAAEVDILNSFYPIEQETK